MCAGDRRSLNSPVARQRVVPALNELAEAASVKAGIPIEDMHAE